MLALVLGLGAGIVYGVGDFIGGLVSRRAALLQVLLLSQVSGTAILFLFFPLLNDAPVSRDALLTGAVAGAAGAGGVALLYRGLARGHMSIVAPVTSVNAASIPVIYGLATGDRPGPLPIVGVVLSLTAIAFVSWSGNSFAEEKRALLREPALLDAIGAGICFGVFFIFLSLAPEDSSMWPLAGARAASVGLFTLVAIVTRASLRPPAGTYPQIAAAGILDAAANILYLLATRQGLLSLVAVLTSLYPAATVVLARVVLHERLTRVQLAGLGLAAVGVTLIALA